MNRYFFIIAAFATIIALTSFYAQDPDLKKSVQRGKTVYEVNCLACHMADGKGVPSVFPPLAKADYMLADKERAIRQTIFGMNGEITVNGVTYYGEMPPQYLTDQEAADVMNYILNSWGNNGGKVTTEQVKKIRAGGKK